MHVSFQSSRNFSYMIQYEISTYLARSALDNNVTVLSEGRALIVQ